MRLNSCCSSQARVLRSFVMENLIKLVHSCTLRFHPRVTAIYPNLEGAFMGEGLCSKDAEHSAASRAFTKGGSVPWMILMPVLGNGERMEIGLQLPIRRRRPFEFECRSISL